MLRREILLTRWAVVRDGSLATPGLIQPGLYAAFDAHSSRFGEWALTACEHDPIAFERFFKVSNLIDPRSACYTRPSCSA